MTVEELIERLKEFRGDMRVVVKGFDEAGYDDVGTISRVEVVLVTGVPGWNDLYRDKDDRIPVGLGNLPAHQLGEAEEAVLINF